MGETLSVFMSYSTPVICSDGVRISNLVIDKTTMCFLWSMICVFYLLQILLSLRISTRCVLHQQEEQVSRLEELLSSKKQIHQNHLDQEKGTRLLSSRMNTVCAIGYKRYVEVCCGC